MTPGILRDLGPDARTVGKGHGEGIAQATSTRDLEAHVAALAPLLAIDDGALADLAGDLREARIVGADDGRAFVGNQGEEIGECLVNRLETTVMVKVIGFDVGHERDMGREVDERTIRFVGLDNVIVARSALGVRVIAIDRAADDEARVKPHAIDGGREHGRCRRLAVRTRAGKRLLALPQRRQRLGTMPDGNTTATSFGKLRVLFREWRLEMTTASRSSARFPAS